MTHVTFCRGFCGIKNSSGRSSEYVKNRLGTPIHDLDARVKTLSIGGIQRVTILEDLVLL
jgi:hypothetical protein